MAWLMIVAALPTACGPSEPEAAAIRAREGAAALKEIGLALPATARVEFVERFHGIDEAARLMIVLPREDWPMVLTTLRASVPDVPRFSSEQAGSLGPEEGRWKPSSAAGLRGVKLAWKGGTQALYLGVAPAGSRQVRVFVVWNEM